MNSRRLGMVSGIVAGIAAILHYASRWLEAWMTPETLPEWAVISTAGTTIGIYSSLLTIAVIAVMVPLAIGGGYYVGREMDVMTEYRRMIRAMVAGSAIGVSGVFTGLISYAGGSVIPATALGWGPVVMRLLNYISGFFEIGLLVIVAMFAGAALAHMQEQNPSTSTPVDSPTDDEAPPDSNHQDDSQFTSTSS